MRRGYTGASHRIHMRTMRNCSHLRQAPSPLHLQPHLHPHQLAPPHQIPHPILSHKAGPRKSAQRSHRWCQSGSSTMQNTSRSSRRGWCMSSSRCRRLRRNCKGWRRELRRVKRRIRRGDSTGLDLLRPGLGGRRRTLGCQPRPARGEAAGPSVPLNKTTSKMTASQIRVYAISAATPDTKRGSRHAIIGIGPGVSHRALGAQARESESLPTQHRTHWSFGADSVS